MDSVDVEVKTILDRIEFSKDKVVDSVNDALSKHPDIIFLVLTFTSAGISLILRSQNHQPSIQQRLGQAIALSSSNRALRKSHQVNEIPIVIFATGVDASNSIYRISSLTITYPVLSINDELMAESEKLKINLD